MRYMLATGLFVVICATAAGQSLPVSDEGAARDAARRYLVDQKVKDAESIRIDLEAFGGNWHRARVTLLSKGGRDYRILLVAADGRVVDPAKESAMETIREAAGVAKDFAGYRQGAVLYLKALRGQDFVILQGIKDIPGYEQHPLPKDLEAIVCEPWTYVRGDSTHFVCYIYQREGGIVERCDFPFLEGKIGGVKSMRLPGVIGDAILYE
jgi:hypothetical protein